MCSLYCYVEKFQKATETKQGDFCALILADQGVVGKVSNTLRRFADIIRLVQYLH